MMYIIKCERVDLRSWCASIVKSNAAAIPPTHFQVGVPALLLTANGVLFLMVALFATNPHGALLSRAS